MRTTSRRGYVVLFLVAVVLCGMGFLGVRLALNGEKWATNRANAHLTSNGSFIAAGNITDRSGVKLASTEKGKRVYNNSASIREATLHIVGDSEGYISSGVQNAYRTELSGYSLTTGIYTLQKYGRGNDVKLTIDSSICTAALDALGSRKGTIAVYNYKTGEILCSVSTPTYDVRNKPSASEINANKNGNYDGLYMNRLFDGLYTPGSTFKVITTTSLIENNVDLSHWSYTCKGYTYFNGVKVTCPEAHGKVNFKSALAESCNGAFATLATKVGASALTKTTTELGFGKSYSIGKIKTSASKFDLTGASESDLAWAGVGQYTTMVNPYHMLTIMGAIANGGTAVLPYVMSEIASPSGKALIENKQQTVTYMTADVAKQVSSMMRNDVKTHYGDYNFSGLGMCGKTGTAEVQDGKKPHAWFVGFSTSKKYPYAIVVVLENSGWGATNAIPAASEVMKAAVKAMS